MRSTKYMYLMVCFHRCNIAECRTGSGSSTGLSYDQEEERDDAKVGKLKHYGGLYKVKGRMRLYEKRED